MFNVQLLLLPLDPLLAERYEALNAHASSCREAWLLRVDTPRGIDIFPEDGCVITHA